MDGGAGGEVVAQALTGEYEPGEIALESVAELGPGAVETALNLTEKADQIAPQQTPEGKSAQDRFPPTGPEIPRPSQAPFTEHVRERPPSATQISHESQATEAGSIGPDPKNSCG